MAHPSSGRTDLCFTRPGRTVPTRLDYFFPGAAGSQYLATPIGPSAGPHTQLSQNIITAWLCGGRFIELKTVQIMDELEIPRPCIDVADEGYNVEWSQELKLEESAQEYINAWAALHILRRLLGWEDTPLGAIFDMSVGYNLEGIQSPRMTRFMNRLADASPEIAEIKAILRRNFPQFADIEIPTQLVSSVTLSTMHGCPPDEIERIARYLLEERGLHTVVKMNPTLLGKPRVLDILHGHLGFTEIEIPDSVFEKDLKYDRATTLIRSLKEAAAARDLTFGVKLSNTLAMHNHRDVMPGDEMYMSGRALYPITMNLYARLMREFDGDLRVPIPLEPMPKTWQRSSPAGRGPSPGAPTCSSQAAMVAWCNGWITSRRRCRSRRNRLWTPLRRTGWRTSSGLPPSHWLTAL